MCFCLGALLGVAMPRSSASAAGTVRVLAYINVSSGCQQATVDLLQQLAKRHAPGVQLELVDFGDGGAGAERWRQSGYRCMVIEINGSPYAKFPERGMLHIVAFKMPAGFQWTHQDLEAAIAAALAGQLRRATPDEAAKVEAAANEAAASAAPAGVMGKATVEEVVRNGKRVARVMLNGRAALTIGVSASGKSPQARAKAAAAALNVWLSRRGKPADVTRKHVKGGWAVLVASRQVIVASAADARAARTTAEAVAISWQAGIRRAVTTENTP
jgi:hypothetical protein